MANPINKYITEIIFEKVNFADLNLNKLDSLETKQGFIIESNFTNLWIFRELSVYEFLGQNVAMESVDSFSIMDGFGMVIWSGNNESTLDYVKGFLEAD